MTVRALIVDDERLARVSLTKLLSRHAEVEIVGEADSLESAVRAVTTLDPDLVLLDISLPDGSGFDLFERLPVRAKVVFVTAHDDHAVRAFAVNALDYLLKPVEPADLARAIGRLGARRTQPDGDRLLDDDVVCLAETGGIKFVRLAEILCIRAAAEYTELSLASGRSVLASTSLRRWQERLPASFARVHRAVIVNLAHVREIADQDGLVAVLGDGRERVPVSRRQGRRLRFRLRAARGL